MGKNTRTIPDLSAKKILEDAGADRVSAKGAKELAGHLIELGVEISKQAVQIAEHSGRKTVSGDDLRLAAKLRRQKNF